MDHAHQEIDKSWERFDQLVKRANKYVSDLDALTEGIERDPGFLHESLKNELAEAIAVAMREERMSVVELSEKLDKSRQYVYRVLKTTANFTLHSVAQIAAALDRIPCISLHCHGEEVVIRPFQAPPSIETVSWTSSAPEGQHRHRVDVSQKAAEWGESKIEVNAWAA
jgi:DNA-binding phage protein